MYHYVRDAEKTPYPGIKGISIKAFVEQISYLQRAYKIISLDQYLGFLKGEENVPTNAAILSFDDGLKDHYSSRFPNSEGETAARLLLPAHRSLD